VKRFVMMAIVALTLACSASPQAQQSPQPPAKDAFVPQAQAPQQPELPAAPLLYGAYAFVWAVLLVYIFLLWRRVGKVERELGDVTRKLKI
jgi:CcmD family protein